MGGYDASDYSYMRVSIPYDGSDEQYAALDEALRPNGLLCGGEDVDDLIPRAIAAADWSGSGGHYTLLEARNGRFPKWLYWRFIAPHVSMVDPSSGSFFASDNGVEIKFSTDTGAWMPSDEDVHLGDLRVRRDAARSAGDYATADAIRDELLASGLVVSDKKKKGR